MFYTDKANILTFLLLYIDEVLSFRLHGNTVVKSHKMDIPSNFSIALDLTGIANNSILYRRLKTAFRKTDHNNYSIRINKFI